ncbi:MAG: AMP-binding protein [Lachnospiraceae bacterium]|nr:AMP-binding protein [Lachnospiraceae bacterium]
MKVKAPWKDHMGDLPFHLEYFQGTLYEAVKKTVQEYPDNIALTFMGKNISYRKMLSEIQRCARSFKMCGVRKGDRVTIAMPNCPQAIYAFYALSCIGAIANMVHPLSAEKELEFYLKNSGSRVAVTLDQFYGKFAAVIDHTEVESLIIARIVDELPLPLRGPYMLTEGRKIPSIPKDAPILWWNEFLNIGRRCHWRYETHTEPNDTAVILYSGGTTGTTKGIELTNLNFNASGKEIVGVNQMFRPGDRMLAAMPIFHGFGLSVCIHSMMIHGGRSILVPRFTAASYAKLIVRYRCNFLAGVPTLYEALTRLPEMKNADLSCLKGVFSGGDTLSIALKRKFDEFLEDHGAVIQVREGYGATETVGACCLTPPTLHKEGSIGVPFPDTYFKIVNPETGEEQPYGEEGEILISGPTVMKGYFNDPVETEKALKYHGDGLRWLYTGDLGVMDEDGFVYFRGRSKRMIVSSGYNIYPAQMENVLDANKMIRKSCVIGVPDDYRMHKVKAFVVLEPGYQANEETWLKLMAYCKKNFAKYAMPYDIEFRDELPTTLIGKVAYRVLEEEEREKAYRAVERDPDEE